MDLGVDFQGPVALFPVEGVVFFPGTHLPLHVFEPRYLQLVADVMVGDQLIAVGMPHPRAGESEQTLPELVRVFTVGRVVRHRPLLAGRCAILLDGLARVALTEELPSEPYRRSIVAVVDERLTLSGLAEASVLAQRIHRLVLDVLVVAPRVFVAPLVAPSFVMSPSHYFDHLGTALSIEPVVKQALLECGDVVARGRILLELLLRLTEAVEHGLGEKT